jgi:sensor histidine kinase regulating citrate/malate metabolism
MTREQLLQAKDPDIRTSLVAMQRAARMARELAVRTDTAIVVISNNQPLRVTAEELRRAGVR